MAIVEVEKLIEAGVHFGHRVSRWHPRMRPYIFGKRNQIHIVDIRETIKGLVRASNFLNRVAQSGKQIVFVGTKRQAKNLVQQEAQRCGMHFVSERWLGGTLTNYHTIRSRLKRLEELEDLEKTGTIEQYSKKRVSRLRRERKKIHRNLEGIRNLKSLPGCLVVIDVRREHIAVKEAKKLGIPLVGLVDTDCDPRDVDLVIPGNDDAYRSVQQVLRILADAITAGRDKYIEEQAAAEKARLEEEERQREAEKAEKAKLAAAAAAVAAAAAKTAAAKTPTAAGASSAKPAATAAPAKAAPAKAAPAKAAPAKTAPAKTAPAKTAPADDKPSPDAST